MVKRWTEASFSCDGHTCVPTGGRNGKEKRREIIDERGINTEGDGVVRGDCFRSV
jgi:hypothetical protein